MAPDNLAFEELLKKFYDNGLLKEVYRSEKAVVCNAFDQFYLTFSLDDVQDLSADFLGYIMVKSSGFLEILRNDNYVNEYPNYLPRGLRLKFSVRLNEDSFDALMKMKEDFAKNPPPSRLDLDFERKVMEKGKAVIKGLRWHKYFLPLLCQKQNPAMELLPIVKESKAFGKMLNRFYEHSLLKEVYRTENVVVCNAFDQFYIVFCLDLVASYSQNFPGFAMNSAGLKRIVEDESFAARFFPSLSSEEQDKALILLNEALFTHFQAHRDEFQQRPAKLDLAFEQELMLKGRETVVQYLQNN